MSANVETDASVVPFNYKMALIDVSKGLRTPDIQWLKFACCDFLPISKFEHSTSAVEFFQHLQQRCLISSPDNVAFLAELLLLIGRIDLLRVLGTSANNVKMSLEDNKLHHVSLYRRLLVEICQDMTSQNVAEFVFLCDSLIPRSRQESMHSPHDLMIFLERQNLVQCGNLSFLKCKLIEISRQDLARKVDSFVQTHGMSGNSSHEVAVYPSIVAEVPRLVHVPAGRPMCVEATNNVSSWRPAGTLEADKPVDMRSDQNFSMISGMLNENSRSQPLDSTVSDDMPCYDMSSIPRGVCIIINNETFHRIDDQRSRKMPDRPGTNRDCEYLQKIFEYLGFIVQVRNNLSHSQLMQFMKDTSSHNHRPYCSFVCCILSHGAIGSVYGTDGITVKIQDLMSPFKAASCPTLLGKPKLFFIQACQGTDIQQGFSPGAVNDDIQTDNSGREQMTIPDEADFLLGMSTVPGCVAYRSKSEGSWYITTLCRNLQKYAERYDLLSILTKVNETVSEAVTSDYRKQVPAPMFTLRKRVCFHSH